jgi:hypothetical protein
VPTVCPHFAHTCAIPGPAQGLAEIQAERDGLSDALLEESKLDQSDLPGLADDSMVVPSGISDSRARLSSAGEFEGYVNSGDLDKLVRQHLLVRSNSPNVRLHVVDKLPSRPLRLGLVIADLADWNRPREDGRVLELLKSIQWRR